MLSKNICNRCRQEHAKGFADIDDQEWWACPINVSSKGVGQERYSVNNKTCTPPNHCPKKLEHAIAEGMKC